MYADIGPLSCANRSHISTLDLDNDRIEYAQVNKQYLEKFPSKSQCMDSQVRSNNAGKSVNSTCGYTVINIFMHALHIIITMI